MKWIKIIGKALLSLFLIFCIGSCSISYLYEETAIGKYFTRKDDHKNGLNSAKIHYENQEFGTLREVLDLYKSYDSEFDLYWEIADGYADYQEALQYRRSKDEEEKKTFVQKVKENARNCRFKENQDFLNAWAKEVELEGF